MNDLDPPTPAQTPGFRLHKLEVYNWGTFDGRPQTVHLDGQTALLIGQNGSGKSTLVDALLTVLVRPGVRNYNVAAGAHKQERDERSYLKGACGRASREDDNRAAVQYLQPGHGHYSALLACFRASPEQAFTLVVLLHLTADGGVEKLYCYSPDERSLATHCSGLATADRLKQQMEKRGFKATTKYTEYHGWFAKALGLRAKAMDVFNQTVAVKDIPSLNRFIREHMLESKPWGQKVEELLAHFTQLSEAHQSLVRVRRQWELLTPVATAGSVYCTRAAELARAQGRYEACEPFFRRKTVELLGPACAARGRELDGVRANKERLDRELGAAREDARQLKNEIEHAGGERLRIIPSLILTCESEARAKRDADRRYREALRGAGVTDAVSDSETFAVAQARLAPLVRELDESVATRTAERDTVAVERHQVAAALAQEEAELASLANRSGNLPDSSIRVRRLLCEGVELLEKELPFVAELIAIRPEERAWEPSAEKVLRPFSLSLLVPERHYQAVARFIDRTRITDAQGSGQRLVYYRVGEREVPPAGPSAHPNSLLRKLRYREGHRLLPWVQAELAARFDIRCCETSDEFQAVDGPAMTRQRHIKWRGSRHEKDDRNETTDPRRFVLGWDNAESDPKKDTILLEELTIAQIPSGPFLLEQFEFPHTVPKDLGRALLVGGVKYGDNDQPWNSLRGSVLEIDELLTVAGSRLKTEQLRGEKATTAKVRELLPQARFAHFATHGFFDAAGAARDTNRVQDLYDDRRAGAPALLVGPGKWNPLLYTGLVFAGANTPVAASKDGGVLPGEVIPELRLDQLYLVVLSACETGLGEESGPEGIQGFQLAFHLAGCPNVVASLWQVNDAATGLLMARFYHELWVNGSPPAGGRCARLNCSFTGGRIWWTSGARNYQSGTRYARHHVFTRPGWTRCSSKAWHPSARTGRRLTSGPRSSCQGRAGNRVTRRRVTLSGSIIVVRSR